MFGTNARIIESRRHGMAVLDLAVAVLEKISPIAVQHARPPGGQRGAMLAGLDSVTGRLDADHPHARLVEEGVKQSDGVRATANTCDERIRKTALRVDDLLARSRYR